MPSQKDVAKRAGVSFMTVSRVINNRENVDEKTRGRVLKVIKELSYYPNNLGRGLNTNKTFSIGIVIPFATQIFGIPYYVELMNGVEKACAEYNYEILLYPKKEEQEKVDYLKLFFERKVDGMLIIAPAINDSQVKLIDEKDIPCVVVDGRQAGNNVIFIDADNVKGGFMATEYIIQQGHKKIGFISGWDFVRNGIDRLTGYKNALKKYNIPINEECIVEGDFTQYSGYTGMMKLLKLPNKPTAIFAANDGMAIGAIKAIKEKNLRVPEDISLIGYDDIEIANYINPPLTTIKQFSFDMGYGAADLLIRKINNKNEKLESKVFDVQLVIRNSVRKT